MPEQKEEELEQKDTIENPEQENSLENGSGNSNPSDPSQDLDPEENLKDNSDDDSDDDSDDSDDSDKSEAKSGLHNSLTTDRLVLVVDEAGQRRDETVEIVKQVLPNSQVEVADTPEQAQEKMDENQYDTCVVNFLMPGFSSSDFVKNVANHPRNPLLVGFSADKMSDAYDPKKGIKIKPLRRIFEIETLSEDSDDMDGDYEEEE